jgi:hypothetical protein
MLVCHRDGGRGAPIPVIVAFPEAPAGVRL